MPATLAFLWVPARIPVASLVIQPLAYVWEKKKMVEVFGILHPERDPEEAAGSWSCVAPIIVAMLGVNQQIQDLHLSCLCKSVFTTQINKVR